MNTNGTKTLRTLRIPKDPKSIKETRKSAKKFLGTIIWVKKTNRRTIGRAEKRLTKLSGIIRANMLFVTNMSMYPHLMKKTLLVSYNHFFILTF